MDETAPPWAGDSKGLRLSKPREKCLKIFTTLDDKRSGGFSLLEHKGEKMTWSYSSRIGMFYIVPNNGRFELVYNNECIGSYDQPWQASDDLSLGAVFSFITPSGKIITDASTLGIPADLEKWQSSSR